MWTSCPLKETPPVQEKQDIKQDFEQDFKKPGLFAIIEAQNISSRAKTGINKLYTSFGSERLFGREDVMTVLNITKSPASELIKKMYGLGLTERITGAGKGKYRFITKREE